MPLTRFPAFLFCGLWLATLGCNAHSPAPASDHLRTADTVADTTASAFAFPFTAADLTAFEKGIRQEAALVQAAQQRGRDAKTAAERAQAAQEEWEDQTIPGGAQAAGLSLERYRQLRRTVNHVLETLSFQRKINGPMEIDLEHATPEMKQRLAGDAFAELPPASAAALKAHLDEVVAAWVQYTRLTAVNG